MKKYLTGILSRIWKSLIIYPILLAIFPVLFLYTRNIDETTAPQALSPLWYAIPGAIVLWLLFYLWMRNPFKAGLATTLLVVLFFFYGRFYSLLKYWGVFVPSHSILLPLLVLVCGYLIYFIWKARRDFRSTTKVFNVIAAMLILLNVFNIVSYQVSKPASAVQATPSQPKVAAATDPSKSNQPDIYYIILEDYANPNVMKAEYGYDDSEFLNNLKSQGFYVALDSQTQADHSLHDISAVLNMEYINDSEAPDVTYQKMENNAVVNFLHSQGYQYVYFGNWYEEGRYTISADIYYNFYKAAETGTMTTEYSSILWNTTALNPFYNNLFGDQYQGYYRDCLLKTLDQMEKVPEMPGPKFTFAHIMCPHPPFVFGPNGEQVPSIDYYNVDDPQYCIGQYIFISRQIDKVIQQILNTSKTDPIIVLQSDEGITWLDTWAHEYILNAFHLPGGGNSLLYSNISPVNTFRLIFDHYFQANYPMLEDK